LADRRADGASHRTTAALATAAAKTLEEQRRSADARQAWLDLVPEVQGAVSAARSLLLEVPPAISTGPQGRTPLHAAALAGELTDVRRLLELGVDPAATDDWGATSLHLAAWEGTPGVVLALLDAGAAVDAVSRRWPSDPAAASTDAADWSEVTPAVVACLAGRADALTALLERGAASRQTAAFGFDVDEKQRRTARLGLLHAAAEGGDAACIERVSRVARDWNRKTAEGITPLHRAARKGHAEAIPLLLALEPASLEARRVHGRTALHDAASVPGAEALEALLAAKATVDARDEEQFTPLHVAAAWGTAAGVRALLRAGASLEARAKTGNTPLHVAAGQGTEEVIETLVAAGAKIEATDTSSHTPLHVAAKMDNLVGLHALLRLGANREAVAHDGFTLIHEAAAHGGLRCLEWLLDNGWHRDRPAGEERWTPLAAASAFGAVESIQRLLARGADPRGRSATGVMPIHVAAEAGQVEAVRWYLEHGIEIDAAAVLDGVQKNCLHLAARTNRTEVVALLLDKGLAVDSRQGNGGTALHVAANHGSREVAALLVRRGASVSATGGNDAWTPLHEAAVNGHARVIELLAGARAPLDATTVGGHTPLMFASVNGRLDAVRALLAAGARVDLVNGAGETALTIAREGGHANVERLLVQAGAR
jgi:ankyrin repeat protein